MASSTSGKLPPIKEQITFPRERRQALYDTRLIPVDHPLLGTAGPDFARTVADLCSEKIVPKMPRDCVSERTLDCLYRKAIYMRKWKLPVAFKGQLAMAEFLPGGRWILPEVFNDKNSSAEMYDHQWTNYRVVGGPKKTADVMLIGKHPGVEEIERGQNFIGQSSEPLHRALREIKVTQATRESWYVTNTVKFNRLDPTSGTMQKAWLNDCVPLLFQEILLVRPRFILLMGTEAIKAVLGKSYTVGNMTNRVIDRLYQVPPPGAKTHADYDDLGSYVEHKISIMAIPHPAYIFRMREAYPDLRAGLAAFVELTGGNRPPDAEENIRHSVYHSPANLGKRIDRILEKAHANWNVDIDGRVPIAWDAEWHGRQPGDAGSYLRTIQFAVGTEYAVRMTPDEPEKDQDGEPENVSTGGPRKASAIVLTEKGGSVGFYNSRAEVAGWIRRLIEGRHSDEKKWPRLPTRHGGHFFKADIPWIREFTGVDFRPHWVPPSPRPKDDPTVKRFDGHAYRRQLAAVAAWDETPDAEREGKRPSEPDPKDPAFIRPHRPYELTRYEGGFDTGYMTHSVFEAMESFNLEQVAMRWTTCPRWDTEVEQAKIQVAKEMGIKVRELIGYGDIPDNVLLPYAVYDADATLRLFWRLNYARANREGDGFLDRDVYQQSSREAFWQTMLAGLAFLEMEESGVTVDVGRGKELIAVFELVKERLTQSLRADLNWPTFNPNSAPQCRAWLFGEEYSGSVDKKTGQLKKQMPDGVKSLELDPIKTTGKPSRSWGYVMHLPAEARKIFTPSVDKEVLGIYSWTNPPVKKLRDIRYVRQVLQSVLRPPRVGESLGADSDGAVFDDMDEFDGGFLSYVNPRDSRVRSRFYPVETGRCSSAAPNMQNLAKRREDDYARILGHLDEDGEPKGDYLALLPGLLYHDPIRSIVTAGMWDGQQTVLMEFDIVSAEIAALAWESGDKQMIKDVNRAMLKENDPDFLDIHSSTAVEAFKLSCAPTKKGLKAIGKPGLRVAAKNVRFGVPYGRSAEALSRQCREEGADVAVADCQRLIENYRKRYPDAWGFLTECELRPASADPYMYGAFGRIRRFQPVDDPGIMAEQGRSAKNYPIQNLVADYILTVMHHLRVEREKCGLDEAFRVVLQIHDALMLEVKVPYLEQVEELVRKVMNKMVTIMPRTLDNTPFDEIRTRRDPKTKELKEAGKQRLYLSEPYRFEVECSVFLNWSQAIDPDRGRAMGIPETYLGGKD